MSVKGVPELAENHATFQDLWQFVFLKLVLLRVGMYAFVDLSRENNYIYHVLINALSAYMIHINLNMIFYTHVEHSPTKTIYIKYYKKSTYKD